MVNRRRRGTDALMHEARNRERFERERPGGRWVYLHSSAGTYAGCGCAGCMLDLALDSGEWVWTELTREEWQALEGQKAGAA